MLKTQTLYYHFPKKNKRLKMKNIFLHIGAGKTGTSALQSQFVINQDPLEKAGIYYPSSNTDEKAKNFQITSGNAVALGEIMKNKETSKSSLKKVLIQDIKNSKGKHILYSSEVLEPFDENNMNIFNEIALNNGYRLKIIYYIRAIGDQTVSLYHQLLKRHLYTKSFTEYLEISNNRFLTIIEKSIRAIGEEHVIIKNYDKVKENITHDFLINVLKVPNINNFQIQNKSVNRSLTKFEVSLMTHMNKFFTKTHQSTFISNALIHTNPNANYRMSIEQKDAERLKQIYANQIEKLNQYLPPEEKSIKLIENLQILEDDKPIHLNPFQSSVLAILAELTKEIKK